MAVKIAILHYHLQPGGVTTVIRNAQRALEKKHAVRLLTDFGYNARPARSRNAFLAESRTLMQQIARRLRGIDVLHCHNVGLGKHPRLTCAIKLLAQNSSIKIINQVHDFPEENRPAQLHALRSCTGRRDDVFRHELCYFDAPNMIWTTLTSHDASKLTVRGVLRERIHVQPNPIDDRFFCRPPPRRVQLAEITEQLALYADKHGYHYDPRRKLLLSPMKVMVRKNNAEAVELIKQLNRRARRAEYQLLISLDGHSRRDRAYSRQLKRQIQRERLPVVIGFGSELENALPLFHLAHAIVTTSHVEGFGYAFMEGWLCNKLVVGRAIPEVTRDFVVTGMDFHHLYEKFDARTVSRVAKLLARPPAKLIAHNRAVVLKKYSLAAYARRYEELLREFAVIRRGFRSGQ